MHLYYLLALEEHGAWNMLTNYGLMKMFKASDPQGSREVVGPALFTYMHVKVILCMPQRHFMHITAP